MVTSAVEIKDMTATNYTGMAELKTAKIVVAAQYKLNNKYALEPMCRATSSGFLHEFRVRK